MLTPNRLQQAIRRRIARLISPDKVRVGPLPTFYPQQHSCQIPELWFLYERFFGQREAGLFVEIGANDGVYVSNTWGLADRGWRGLMVEPIAELAQACRANHASHPLVTTINSAIGRAGVDELQLSVAGPLTTANAAVLGEYQQLDWARPELTTRTVTVPCITLDNLLSDQNVTPEFDLLVIDVEGFEAEVMSAFDLNRWRPRMIIIELADAHPDLTSTAQTDHDLARRIIASDYEIAFKDSINTVFVASSVWNRSLAEIN